MKCPICNSGNLVRKKVKHAQMGIELGSYEADVCETCSEVFFTEESAIKIEEKAKKLGIWGLGARTKVGYSGNSLIIRVSKEIADFMELERGEEVFVYPKDKEKLIVEVE